MAKKSWTKYYRNSLGGAIKRLSRRKLDFIDAYINSENITNISKKLNLSRQTLYNYLKDDEVKKEIKKRKEEMINESALLVQKQLKNGAEELIKIFKDKQNSPQIKINAINSLYSIHFRLREQQDIISRIDHIEEILEDREGVE